MVSYHLKIAILGQQEADFHSDNTKWHLHFQLIFFTHFFYQTRGRYHPVQKPNLLKSVNPLDSGNQNFTHRPSSFGHLFAIQLNIH
jgi:hypothetical protein